MTRALVAQMDGWLDRLVKDAGYPEQREDRDGLVYRYRDESPYVVQIAKMVRVASGLNACLLLADHGYVAEAATLLRTVSDFSSEVLFLVEGNTRKDGPTSDQRQFVMDFFSPVPATVEEMKVQDRRRWLSRDAIYKAHRRLAERTPGADAESLIDQARLLDVFQNGYVHGGYRESMDLYNGFDRRFETHGIPSIQHERALKQNIALKTYYCAFAFAMMALERGLTDLAAEIMSAQQELEVAPEYG